MKKLKKFIIVLASMIAVVCLAVGLVGCSSDVNGSTYTFNTSTFNVNSFYADYYTDKEIYDTLTKYNNKYEGTTISFADGVATMTQGEYSTTYSYKQSFFNVTLYEDDEECMTFTVSSSSLVMNVSYGEHATIKITFDKV